MTALCGAAVRVMVVVLSVSALCVSALCVSVLCVSVIGGFAPGLAQAQDAPPDAPVEQAVPEPVTPDETEPAETEPNETEPAETEPADIEAVDVEAVQSENIEAEREPGPWDVGIPCENVQHPYQAELCQQWRTAEAAEETARASRRSLALSRLLMLTGVATTGLLLLMFLPVLAAAFAARRAARGAAGPASGHGAQERNERAYVDVDRLEFIETPESEGVVKVRVDLRNSGQTPALKLKTVAEVGVREVSDEGLLPVMTLPDRASADPARPRLGRDAVATQIIACDSPPKLADRVTSGEATILVWGFAEYGDVFDRKHRTTFQYLCNAETLKTGQIFKPMVRGDEDG